MSNRGKNWLEHGSFKEPFKLLEIKCNWDKDCLEIYFEKWPKQLLIDAYDWNRLGKDQLNLRFHVYKNYYEITLPHTKPLHEFILGKKEGFVIDHRNHNVFDARRKNLRHITQQQNCFNCRGKGLYKNRKSQFKGVSPTSGGKWQARIGFKYDEIYLGQFEEQRHAAWCRDTVAKILFGEFAFLNFPNSEAFFNWPEKAN